MVGVVFVPRLVHCVGRLGKNVTVMRAAFYPKLIILRLSATGKKTPDTGPKPLFDTLIFKK